MSPSLGEYIRQLRRQRSLTQTALGAERYSKSYVSAMERGTLVPTDEAVRFFAEQLNQPGEDFEHLLEQTKQEKQFVSLPANQTIGTYEWEEQNEVTALLDLILEGTNLPYIPLPSNTPTLSGEVIKALPPSRQARYTFLQGLVAQRQGDLNDAFSCFEYALALAPARYQPAILDALGNNYYLAQSYEVALNYHRRALTQLQESAAEETTSDLLLQVELHCGDDYRALGAHRHACEHYERARQHLRASHNMHIAGQLYLGLGYCTYAALYQNHEQAQIPAEEGTTERQEQAFQRAVGFLLQSRALYQASHDSTGELTARILQTVILLDFSMWRRQLAQQKAGADGKLISPNCAALLDDAEEQCRQIIMEWQEAFSDVEAPPAELEIAVYTALAFLVRVYMQRATLARLGEYVNTATRELSLAAALCQRVLNSFSQQTLSRNILTDLIDISREQLSHHDQALPRLPGSTTAPRHPMSRARVYFAAGEVAEEFGRAATTFDYACNCYARADYYFLEALKMMRQTVLRKAYDASYLVRCYQRYVSILEERMVADPSTAEQVNQVLFALLKEGLHVLPYSPP